jgi:hypothetical protein
MIDLGPQKTFKWGAFEPTDQDLRDYARSRRERKKELARKSNGSVRVGNSRSSPAASTKSTPVKDLLELSDSDDDLPGLSSLVRPPKRHKNSVINCFYFHSSVVVERMLLFWYKASGYLQ